MIALICGGREYADQPFMYKTLDELNPDEVVVGGAPGADTMAEGWAIMNGVARHVHPANWSSQGKSAGPIRNQEMLDMHPDIDVVIAFPGGSGTADMVRRAEAAGIEVREIKDE